MSAPAPAPAPASAPTPVLIESTAEEALSITVWWRCSEKFTLPVGVKLLSPRGNQLAHSGDPFTWYVRWDTLHYYDKDGAEHEVKRSQKFDVILQPDGSTVRKQNTDHFCMEEKFPESVTFGTKSAEAVDSEIYYDSPLAKFLCKAHRKKYDCSRRWVCIVCGKDEMDDM